MNKVVHFEIAADDVSRAKKFYNAIFDWKFVDMPGMDYVMIHTVPTDKEGMLQETGGINGGMFKRPNLKGNLSIENAGNGGENAYVCTVGVENINETSAKVTAAGGKVIMPKKEIPSIGFTARCLDTEGNIFTLIQPSRS